MMSIWKLDAHLSSSLGLMKSSPSRQLLASLGLLAVVLIAMSFIN